MILPPIPSLVVKDQIGNMFYPTYGDSYWITSMRLVMLPMTPPGPPAPYTGLMPQTPQYHIEVTVVKVDT